MTSLPEDSLFKSQLNEASKQKARNELNERNDKDRDAAVQTLRQWVQQQNWLRSPTDYEFLLRFLRVRKFSQLEARKTIENYWTMRTQYPKVVADLDPTDPIMQEIFREGIFSASRNVDKNGCRLLSCNLGRISLEKVKAKWGKESIYKAFFLISEWLNYDENVQVNGVKHIWEYTDLSFNVVKYFITAEYNQLVTKFMSKCMPARVKGIYTYNDPPFLDVILSMFVPFLSKKLKDRIHTNGKNLTKLYEHVDKDVLPDEYLPDDYTGPSAGPLQQVIGGDDSGYDVTKVPRLHSENFLDQVWRRSGPKALC